jgi:flavin reductase (DIM6/NTAB) family NADH-FMN oxidoreductase RutF
MDNKIKINNNAFVYPMPMVLVGSKINGQANFMPVGWVARMNANPPLIGAAMGKRHFTNQGIHEHQEFSINIPDVKLITATDYCGLVSGQNTNKATVFDLFYGILNNSPMIKACPICMECKLVQTIDFPSNTLFVGEIINVYTEEKFLTDGKPDPIKIDPFTLTMPDNNYWSIGQQLGKAWNIGKNLKEQKT